MDENFKYRIPDQISTKFQLFGIKYWYEYLAAVLILLFNALLLLLPVKIGVVLIIWIVTAGIPFSLLLIETNGIKLYEDLNDIIKYHLRKRKNNHFQGVEVKGEDMFVVYRKDISEE